MEAVDRVLEYPKAWPEIDPGVRRRLAGRFPYALLYSIEEKEIPFLAVMHLHRDPRYWRSRIAGGS